MTLFSAFWARGPAFSFCTGSHASRSWLCAQFFISFNPWHCPKEKFLNLLIFFCPLEVASCDVSPRSANVTGVHTPVCSSVGSSLVSWGQSAGLLSSQWVLVPELFFSRGPSRSRKVWEEYPPPPPEYSIHGSDPTGERLPWHYRASLFRDCVFCFPGQYPSRYSLFWSISYL